VRIGIGTSINTGFKGAILNYVKERQYDRRYSQMHAWARINPQNPRNGFSEAWLAATLN